MVGCRATEGFQCSNWFFLKNLAAVSDISTLDRSLAYDIGHLNFIFSLVLKLLARASLGYL